MSSPPPSLADFRPVVGNQAPTAKKFRFSRSVVIIAVVGAHVIAGALFALPRVIKAVEQWRTAPAGPPVQLVDMEITAAETSVAAKSRKPRLLKPGAGETPAQLAQRAGIVTVSPVRTLLLVNISKEGKAGDVMIAESSSNPQLDRIAVQYAQAQAWVPVSESEDVTASVPFVVDFPASDPG